MGKVLVAATIENIADLYNADRGLISPDQVRRVEVAEALVDTGATLLSMPGRMIEELGLMFVRNRQARTAAGTVTLRILGGVRLTIGDRVCSIDVGEVPDDCPVLIGQLPLEALDLVFDPNSQQVTGNPAHGGEHIIDLY